MDKVIKISKIISGISIIACILNIIVCVAATMKSCLPFDILPYRTLIWIVCSILTILILHTYGSMKKDRNYTAVFLMLIVAFLSIFIEKAMQFADNIAFSKILENTEHLTQISKQFTSTGSIVAAYQMLNYVINSCQIFIVIIIACTSAKLAFMYAVRKLDCNC